MRNITLLAASFTAVFALFIAAIWAFQERIAFQPQGPPFPDPGSATRVDYRADDGQRLFAYVIGNPEHSRGLIIAFHGNADLAVRQVDWAREIVERTGWTVMIPEFRGYMGLDGKPGYISSRQDAEAAYAFARDSLSTPADRIALFGHSMGSAIAAELAARHRPAALLLQSPFTSAREMAIAIGGRAFNIAWAAISRLHFDTVALVARLDAPVWVSHGADDRTIPTRMGKNVFAAAKVKGELLIVPAGSHNDVGLEGGESYWRWITAALDMASSSRLRKTHTGRLNEESSEETDPSEPPFPD